MSLTTFFGAFAVAGALASGAQASNVVEFGDQTLDASSITGSAISVADLLLVDTGVADASSVGDLVPASMAVSLAGFDVLGADASNQDLGATFASDAVSVGVGAIASDLPGVFGGEAQAVSSPFTSGGIVTDDPTQTISVPLPAPMALAGAGLVGLVARRRRR